MSIERSVKEARELWERGEFAGAWAYLRYFLPNLDDFDLGEVLAGRAALVPLNLLENEYRAVHSNDGLSMLVDPSLGPDLAKVILRWATARAVNGIVYKEEYDKGILYRRAFRVPGFLPVQASP